LEELREKQRVEQAAHYRRELAECAVRLEKIVGSLIAENGRATDVFERAHGELGNPSKYALSPVAYTGMASAAGLQAYLAWIVSNILLERPKSHAWSLDFLKKKALPTIVAPMADANGNNKVAILRAFSNYRCGDVITLPAAEALKLASVGAAEYIVEAGE
jgi:hypothetical protein